MARCGDYAGVDLETGQRQVLSETWVEWAISRDSLTTLQLIGKAPENMHQVITDVP